MILAVASGKGGTGKTTVAVNLALCSPKPVRLLDCDVEEPNCHIFLKPSIHAREAVSLPVPFVDEAKCNACGECARFCQYHAIVSLRTGALVFPELCHGCGGCAKVCPTGAITEVTWEIGVVETGVGKGVQIVQGRLNIGHPMAPPVIHAVKRHTSPEALSIIDCPPGTSCPVVAAMRGSDYVLLVTEPTPFGLHDLKLAVATTRQLGIPFGVVINRADVGDARVAEYCRSEGIQILLEIPEDRRIAEAYSCGKTAVEAIPGMREVFTDLLARVAPRLKRERGAAHAHV